MYNKAILLHKETIKMLTIVKKKQFRGTNVSIYNRSDSFNKQAFLDFRNELIISICQDGKFLERGDIIEI